MTPPAIFLTLSVSCAFLKRSYLRVPSENFFFLTAVASPPPFIKLPRKEAMTGSVGRAQEYLCRRRRLLQRIVVSPSEAEHLVCEDWDQMAYYALENTNGRFTCSWPLALGVHPGQFITDTPTFQLVLSSRILQIWTSPVLYLSISILILISPVPHFTISLCPF